MSTDGTKPPSITPKKSGARGPRTTSPRGRKGSGTTKAGTATEMPPPPPGGGPASTNWAPASSGPGTGSTGTGSTGTASTGTGSTGTGSAGTATEAPESTSMGERLKRAGRSVSDAARSAAPKGDSARGDSSGRPLSSTTAAPHSGPRRVRLSVARIDPWSVMKLSFLLSIAIGIMLVVAAAVIWYTLDAQAVFTQVDDTIAEITGDPEFFDVLAYMSFERVLALATVIAVVDIVLLTALSTIGAFLYNIVSALVGGINVTLTDD